MRCCFLDEESLEYAMQVEVCGDTPKQHPRLTRTNAAFFAKSYPLLFILSLLFQSSLGVCMVSCVFVRVVPYDGVVG